MASPTVPESPSPGAHKHSSSVHTHSPALLRAAISSITDRNSPDAIEDWKGNIVVSHPPSPTSVPANLETANSDAQALADVYRPYNSITPLNPDSLRRIPLSTPPSTPPPDRKGSVAQAQALLEKTKLDQAEDEYPLILVTGGSGFIGSHTVLEILQEGKYGVVVIDNMANSNIEVLHRVRILAAKYHKDKGLPTHRHPPLYFHPCDIQDRAGLATLFELYARTPTTSRIASAIHFAALKSVSGSLSDPIAYYQINVGGTLNLVEVLAKWKAKKLVFSSSCVVYGSECDGEGITEDMCDVQAGASKGITNPYGRTKRMCEEVLADLSVSDPEWLTMSLRYTNPSGAHPSGYIGEDPTNAANLMPLVTHVLQGKREHVKIYGADYNTPDGTGVRDFIHVVDLAKAHLAAIRHMCEGKPLARNSTYNLGTNKGTSVLTVIETLSLVAQRPIKIVVSPRRPGDLACVVCCAEKAEKELGWKAEMGILEMARDMVHWQFLNPNGYSSGSREEAEAGETVETTKA
ncbi:hypothetical protein BCR35DRAFT_290674 [Leucosporidium creatinivorum]|uniref:NAD-dependent epimerase/dehydratase domain-containing protein n=1 Tax=Leucosporidium creatinivorum TaxID=106004 RepID=A0A1Y2FH19_9BASI|nr:hypothetical protein BCR35DRAFT_290674 [Leucosporidium creatinivorum]